MLLVCILLAGCGEDDTSFKKSKTDSDNPATAEENPSSETTTDLFSNAIRSYENEHGAFEVHYEKDNLVLVETVEDFGLEVSSVEYGVFSVSDAYDYYTDLEDKEGKIGYVKIHIAMNLPTSIDPAQFFFPHQATLSISEKFFPTTSDNNFADEVAVNLGEVAAMEGNLFYLLSSEERKALEETKSFTLTALAPFTSKNMDLKEGYVFSITLD